MLGLREWMLGLMEGILGFHKQDRWSRLMHGSAEAEGPYRGRQMLQHIGSHIHPDEVDLGVQDLSQEGNRQEANLSVHPAVHLETVSVDMVAVENRL